MSLITAGDSITRQQQRLFVTVFCLFEHDMPHPHRHEDPHARASAAPPSFRRAAKRNHTAHLTNLVNVYHWRRSISRRHSYTASRCRSSSGLLLRQHREVESALSGHPMVAVVNATTLSCGRSSPTQKLRDMVREEAPDHRARRHPSEELDGEHRQLYRGVSVAREIRHLSFWNLLRWLLQKSNIFLRKLSKVLSRPLPAAFTPHHYNPQDKEYSTPSMGFFSRVFST